jgi:hypothetical protein
MMGVPTIDQNKLESLRSIIDKYSDLVKTKYPRLIKQWPIISGYNLFAEEYNNYLLIYIKHTGILNRVQLGFINLSDLFYFLDINDINETNLLEVKNGLKKFFNVNKEDGVTILKKEESVDRFLSELLEQHELTMGIAKNKIFLSHKDTDNNIINNFAKTLTYLGFNVWNDDNLNAGVSLNREIIKGFNDSCAAIFFITENFRDEKFIADEIDYAISEKRIKDNKFSIITLVMYKKENENNVPNLLKKYVYKNPKNDLEALRIILDALPLKINGISWK